jgi:tetratricopeptide (TPR) repeat protein
MVISEFSFEELAAQGHERRRAGDRTGSLAAFQAAHRLHPTHLGAQLEIINGLRDLERYDEAAAMAEQAIAQHPKAPAPYVSLGLLKRNSKDGTAAVAAFEAAIAVGPDHPGAHLELANDLRALGQIERADAIIEDISQRRPDVAGVQAALGMLKRRRGDRLGSLAAFRAAALIDPNFVGVHLEMANDLRELGDLDEAEGVLHELLSRHPRSAAAWTSLGLIARRRGDHEAALAALASAADVEPGNIGTQLERANELRFLKRFPEAEEILTALVKSHPSHPAPLIGLAQLKRNQGDRLSSLATFQSVAHLDPADVLVKVEIVNDLRELRRYAEAEALLKEALSSHPKDARVLAAMGHLKRRQGDRSGSLAMFEAAAVAEPNNFYLQLECANDLRDLGRFAEAERILRQVVLERPQEAMPLVATAHLHRRRGNRPAALEILRAAAAKDPANVPLQIEIVQSLIEFGQLDEAAQTVRSLLARDPDDPSIVLQQVELLRRKQHRRESLDYLESVSQRNPTQVNYLVEMAADQLVLGHPDRAVALNERALALEPENLPALLQAFHFAAIGDHWKDAAEICHRAIHAHPGTSGPRINAARAYFELGHREEAFAFICEARERLGALPEFSMREAELFRLIRNWTAVRELVARERQSEAGTNFALRVHLVEVEILTANFDRAKAELNAMTPSTVIERASHAHLAGLLAEAKFQYAMAATHYRTAIKLNPTDHTLHLDLARLCLVTLDLEGCQDALSSVTGLTQSSALRQGLSPKLRHNFVGQLLDEFRLEPKALAQLLELRSFSDERQLPLLRDLVKTYPDYTPGALLAIVMLRRSGHFDSPIDPLGLSIPGRIVQYWHDTPPSDVIDLMATWQRHNPNYEWQCVDDKAAENFLAAYFPSPVADAYKAAYQPAQKADLFRLAWLAKNGGIYVDADDACTAPIDLLIPAGVSLVVYQENYGSIANNFIAAVPEHPVILAALDLAVQALLRGDHDIAWLSTGPGLMTRAFAQHWAASEDSSWLNSVSVMTLGEMQRVVAVHCHARYKSTTRSWTKASFVRGNRKVARDSLGV